MTNLTCAAGRLRAERRLQGDDVGNRIGDGHLRQGILNQHDGAGRSSPTVEGEAQRVDVRMRIHVDVQRGLRHADLDLRPPVGRVHARHRGPGRRRRRSRRLRRARVM